MLVVSAMHSINSERVEYGHNLKAFMQQDLESSVRTILHCVYNAGSKRLLSIMHLVRLSFQVKAGVHDGIILRIWGKPANTVPQSQRLSTFTFESENLSVCCRVVNFFSPRKINTKTTTFRSGSFVIQRCPLVLMTRGCPWISASRRRGILYLRYELISPIKASWKSTLGTGHALPG